MEGFSRATNVARCITSRDGDRSPDIGFGKKQEFRRNSVASGGDAALGCRLTVLSRAVDERRGGSIQR